MDQNRSTIVNPAALEAGHGQCNERPEYVMVLRVLTKDAKTQEFRDEPFGNNSFMVNRTARLTGL
jgi:hypothetical protein